MKSTSSLTRSVFRAIIANRPYAIAECRHRVVPFQRTCLGHRYTLSYTQRRHIFGFITGAPSSRGFQGARATPKNLELALGRLIDLVSARRSQSRPAANEELIDALKFLFLAHLEIGRPLTRNEVFLATETFKHLQEQGVRIGEGDKESLSKNDFLTALSALALSSGKERSRHNVLTLGKLIYEAAISEDPALSSELLQPHATILASNGAALEALELVRQEASTGTRLAWIEVLKGFIAEARENEFWKIFEEFQQKFGDLKPKDQEQLAVSFAQRDQIWAAQQLHETKLSKDAGPTTETIKQLLEMAIRLGKGNWADSLAAQLSRRVDKEDVVGTLILWHTTQDSNPNSVGLAIHRLLETSPLGVSMDTFNRVIEYALKNNNPSLASAMRKLAASEGFRPNGKTHALQLQRAIDREDFPGAVQEFEAMLMEDIPADDSDLPILNRFIAKLSFASDQNYELLMRLVDTMIERNADLEPEAVAGLCHVFLKRDEIDDATGLLRRSIDFYSAADRAGISAIFQTFIISPETHVQRAFNAYELFRHAFPETPVAQRLPIMQSFFDRKRPDLACLVFGHMRQREDPDDPARPTADAYTQCFEGIAQCRDVDGLQMVYNMLKLDIEVDRTTQIRNGLMLAYAACQMSYASIIDHFWKVMDSREGPSYSTFEVALRACETWVPYGSFEARKIIAVMQEWNLEITKNLYDCYIGAIAGQSEFEDAVELIERMENDIGEHPDAVTIGTFYNAIPWQYRKDEVEKWAKKAYPDLWEELLIYGDEIDEEWEVRYFKIDRSIDISDPPLFAEGEWKPELSRKTQARIEPLALKV